MQNNSNTQNKVEATLNSLDDIQRANPDPYFYTRLSARMQNQPQNIWQQLSVLITKPAVAFACVLVVIMMNVFIIFSSSDNTSSATTDSGTELAMADEYTQLEASPIYDYETVKP